MNKDLFIDSTTGSGVTLALLEDRKLVELNSDDGDAQFSVGDLYLGRVKKVMAGLNAAFVDVGYEKDAFLHYLDLGAQYKSLNKFVKSGLSNQQIGPLFEGMKFEKDIDKNGKITNVLASKQNVLVQIGLYSLQVVFTCMPNRSRSAYPKQGAFELDQREVN